jgi:hypothetical protein
MKVTPQGWKCSSVVEHLSGKYRVLSSTPNTGKKEIGIAIDLPPKSDIDKGPKSLKRQMLFK